MATPGLVIPQEISMLLTSDPAQGASNVSTDGSQFTVQLEEAIDIPRDAMNVTVSVEESTIWWVIPNIITGQNDKLYITAPDTSDVTTVYVITIPQGLYDLSGLNQAILRELENAGAKTSPEPVINLSADENTQKVEIRFEYAVVEIDFTQSDTFRDILGFNSQVLGPYIGAPVTVLANNVAAFNTVNSFLIHSDIINSGLRFNNTYNQTLSQVLIDVTPGSQIVSKPFNPAKVNGSELAGAKRTNLTLWLTDEKNRAVNTNGEVWTARIVIRYLKPIVFGK